MNTVYVSALVVIGLAIFGYLIKLQSGLSSMERVHEKLCEHHEKRMERLENETSHIPEIIAKLDTWAKEDEIYHRIMDQYIADTIHSPVHKERDILTEKLRNGSITHDDLVQLRPMLYDYVRTEKDPHCKFVGSMALARVESLLYRMSREHHKEQEICGKTLSTR